MRTYSNQDTKAGTDSVYNSDSRKFNVNQHFLFNDQSINSIRVSAQSLTKMESEDESIKHLETIQEVDQ